MTKLLEKAFEKASTLPERDQDAVGEWLLSELESEARWAKLFAGSQDSLSKLAAEALEEHRKGETEDLNLGR
jgi:hypothetical protein